MTYLGIGVHSRTSVWALMDEQGKQVGRGKEIGTMAHFVHDVISCASARSVPTLTRDRTISVTSTAVTHTTPDIVVWHVTTASEHRNLDVDTDDLQTGYLDVSREYERDNYGNVGDFKHFRVTRQITIKERDTSHFDDVLTGLVHSADTTDGTFAPGSIEIRVSVGTTFDLRCVDPHPLATTSSRTCLACSNSGCRKSHTDAILVSGGHASTIVRRGPAPAREAPP